jgi:hypothetical protein
MNDGRRGDIAGVREGGGGIRSVAVACAAARRACLLLGVAFCVLLAAACSASSSQPDSSFFVKGKSNEIRLVPEIEAGSVGWCVTEPNGGGCGEGPIKEPIIAQQWSSSGPPEITEGSALTTSTVAAVRVDGGMSVPTRRESALPDGLRAVAVEIRGQPGRGEADAGTGRSRHPRFTALNAQGQVIPERQTTLRLSLVELPTEAVQDVAHPTGGSCRIEQVAAVTGMSAAQGRILTQVRPYRELLGEALLPCATTTYRAGPQSIEASILLNAAHPGHEPPSLPGMQALTDHPGIFEAPGLEGKLIGRRTGDGWLVVGGHVALSKQVALLDHLSTTISV